MGVLAWEERADGLRTRLALKKEKKAAARHTLARCCVECIEMNDGSASTAWSVLYQPLGRGIRWTSDARATSIEISNPQGRAEAHAMLRVESPQDDASGGALGGGRFLLFWAPSLPTIPTPSSGVAVRPVPSRAGWQVGRERDLNDTFPPPAGVQEAIDVDSQTSISKQGYAARGRHMLWL
jgi:hypothetical protein